MSTRRYIASQQPGGWETCDDELMMEKAAGDNEESSSFSPGRGARQWAPAESLPDDELHAWNELIKREGQRDGGDGGTSNEGRAGSSALPTNGMLGTPRQVLAILGQPLATSTPFSLSLMMSASSEGERREGISRKRLAFPEDIGQLFSPIVAVGNERANFTASDPENASILFGETTMSKQARLAQQHPQALLTNPQPLVFDDSFYLSPSPPLAMAAALLHQQQQQQQRAPQQNQVPRAVTGVNTAGWQPQGQNGGAVDVVDSFWESPDFSNREPPLEQLHTQGAAQSADEPQRSDTPLTSHPAGPTTTTNIPLATTSAISRVQQRRPALKDGTLASGAGSSQAPPLRASNYCSFSRSSGAGSKAGRGSWGKDSFYDSPGDEVESGFRRKTGENAWHNAGVTTQVPLASFPRDSFYDSPPVGGGSPRSATATCSRQNGLTEVGQAGGQPTSQRNLSIKDSFYDTPPMTIGDLSGESHCQPTALSGRGSERAGSNLLTRDSFYDSPIDVPGSESHHLQGATPAGGDPKGAEVDLALRDSFYDSFPVTEEVVATEMVPSQTASGNERPQLPAAPIQSNGSSHGGDLPHDSFYDSPALNQRSEEGGRLNDSFYDSPVMSQQQVAGSTRAAAGMINSMNGHRSPGAAQTNGFAAVLDSFYDSPLIPFTEPFIRSNAGIANRRDSFYDSL